MEVSHQEKNRVDKINSNGLLGLCTEINLVITNTIFRMKNQFKASCMHSCSRHWHLLDYIITKQKDIADIQYTSQEPCMEPTTAG